MSHVFDSNQQSAAIDVKASYKPLAFVLALFKPKASVNGAPPIGICWGSNPVPVPPGRYHVEVWVPYLFFRRAGRNGAVVDVPADGLVEVHWLAPNFAFLKGSISVHGPMPLPGGWFPDPSGRHESRYFDGRAWTDHVASGGVHDVDRIVS